MGQTVAIKVGSLSNVLKYLGSMYPNAAEAMKEHVSNALDEHIKARKNGTSKSVCNVRFTMRKEKIIIEYPYGMSEDEFRRALQEVALSNKKDLKLGQIGQLGIGMFSFFQVGERCTFYSRKNGTDKTIKVIIREGDENAEFERPKKRECLEKPGIKIVIEKLLLDPTRGRGPLGVQRLQNVFSKKFNPYLQDGSLVIQVHYPGKKHSVTPSDIDLPRVDKGYETVYIDGDPDKKIELELYYDPTEKGRVSIRHTGVVVVDDISSLDALGVEDSIYGSGNVTGYIEANFLEPLPSRTAFKEGKAWYEFLVQLDQIAQFIEAYVQEIQNRQKQKLQNQMRQKALKVTRDIFDKDIFRDLELLEGMGRRMPQPQLPPDGFNFIPSTLRVDVGETKTIPLRALVPEVMPDGVKVHFLTSSRSVSITPTEVVLRSEDADDDGMVKVHVEITGRKLTDKSPVIITADTEIGQSEAYVRVAPKTISRDPIQGHRKDGRGLNYEYREFPDGAKVHSRYTGRMVQINTLNPDYQEASDTGEEDLLLYTAIILGKETLAFNDKTGLADEFLDRFISYWFMLMREIG